MIPALEWFFHRFARCRRVDMSKFWALYGFVPLQSIHHPRLNAGFATRAGQGAHCTIHNA